MASSQFEPVREIEEQHETMLDSCLGRGTRHALFRGRPDIVIELYDSEGRKNLTDVVLGEIKYTDSQQTFSKGLEELLSYLEFAQRDGYLSDLDVDCRGVLITDGVETDVPTSADGRITHI
ncbi:hypothetical protein [Halorientalis sp.]|uniref:hypothetical protein n=1 Tax=Halorientalis sp. TaxID=1931229 RepID=UPI00261F2EE1|nr:hypothetical protein [Halorientalis sp.]